jgi:hypothetical protein
MHTYIHVATEMKWITSVDEKDQLESQSGMKAQFRFYGSAVSQGDLLVNHHLNKGDLLVQNHPLLHYIELTCCSRSIFNWRQTETRRVYFINQIRALHTRGLIRAFCNFL